MIANYRVQAELTSIESTEDGRAIVLGTIDGCVSVLAIVDTEKKDMGQYLATMPSRDEEVIKKSYAAPSKNILIFLFSNRYFHESPLTSYSIFSHSFIHSQIF